MKQPPLPPEDRLTAMTVIMIEARRAKLDIGEIIAVSLHAAAEQLGGVEYLVTGRPGSWEADIIRRMASESDSQAGQDTTYVGRLAPLFVEMGKAREDGGDVLSQAMGLAA